MENISVSTNGSIIEDSILFGQFGWPEYEPDMTFNGNLISSALREVLLEKCSFSKTLPSEQWWKEKRKKNSPLHLLVRDYLNHPSIQFNSRNIFSSCLETLEKIKSNINEKREIDILLPVFCVISNWQKRHDITSVTMAEEVSLLHLANISIYLEKNTGVRIRFNILSDATFYAGIFGDPMDAAEQYIKDLKEFTHVRKINEIVNILDISEIVSLFQDNYDCALSKHLKTFTLEPSFGISHEEAIRFNASVGSTVNISDLSLTYNQKKAIFCDAIFPDLAIKHEIMNRVHTAFIQYRAMKEAMASIQWEKRLFPNAIRATIHHKTIPVLGIRIYPGYKNYSPHLPYHGIAVVEHRNNVWRMSIEQEIQQHGKRLRIINSRGVSDFYIDTDTLEGMEDLLSKSNLNSSQNNIFSL
ncbi:L-tyrosine/L-tryptophan isonitrile synthase family protein [Xenorhabdus sp. Flor]|uniref:L-tyrosine/L-tryptophan isonitrile synthase family protein n=1 Tax=Xenorhabdus cabanillasii TaxID=351673 RepID=UPI0019828F0A|nr:L-tyrosine/L-tryptophan isonitrile synthase family protein [Xenorhabdus sp. Flor]MBD2813848.1 L-tyrosine/L-tryptophan isonitrile synthase family protein [Xenorhabdus sp. Flor]